MLDNRRRKAVVAIGDFGHRASLPSAFDSELSGYRDKANLASTAARKTQELDAITAARRARVAK
jgi:hypothetical protein